MNLISHDEAIDNRAEAILRVRNAETDEEKRSAYEWVGEIHFVMGVTESSALTTALNDARLAIINIEQNYRGMTFPELQEAWVTLAVARRTVHELLAQLGASYYVR